MRRKLIIDGNAVYEIDDDCSRRKEKQQETESMRNTDQKITDASGSNNVHAKNSDKICRDGIKKERDIRFCGQE